MKTLMLVLVLALGTPISAEHFRPETVNGAVLGSIAGVIIGHNDGRRGREGAAIGAVVGGLIGSNIGARREMIYRVPPSYPVYRYYDQRPLYQETTTVVQDACGRVISVTTTSTTVNSYFGR
jgi:phage tail tape-measure protein